MLKNYEYQHSKQTQQQQQQQRGNLSDRHDSYDGSASGRPVGNQTTHQVRYNDDRSHSGHGPAHTTNNYMPPRYPPQTSSTTPDKQARYHRQAAGHTQEGGYMFSPNGQGVVGNIATKGGTGTTDDSFLSSFKAGGGQSYAGQGYGNPNFSQMALTANSFQMGDAQSNSFDAAAANHLNRGMPQAFSNTATDWNSGQRVQYLDMGAGMVNDHISDTRSNNQKWQTDFNKLDAKYMRDDSLNIAQQRHQLQNKQSQYHHAEPQYFINQKHTPKAQLDRLEDDDQRSPERGAKHTIMVDPSYSPERDNNFVDFSQQRSQSAMINNATSNQQSRLTNVSSNSYSRATPQRTSQQASYSPSSYLQPNKQNSSTLSDLLQTKSARRTPQAAHQLESQNKQQSSTLFSGKQVSAPQKSRKSGRVKTILDQKEHFKIRPARCYMGPEVPQVHYSQRTLTWQDAIACIEDLGVNMSSHYKEAQNKGITTHTDLQDGLDFKQGALSDGFKNWTKPRQNLQTDFYNRMNTLTQNDEDLSQQDSMAQPMHTQVSTKKSLTQNNFFSHQKHSDNLSAESLHKDGGIKESSANQNKNASPVRGALREQQQQRSPNFKQLEDQQVQVQQQPNRVVTTNIISQQPVPPMDSKPSNQSQTTEAEAIQTLKNLRYSDLIYLLNILKLQRSKNAENLQQYNGVGKQPEQSWQQAKDQWVTDLQLALSVAVSAEDRDSKDTNAIARFLIEQVEACRNEKFTSSSIEQPESIDLKYEHFIGPLVVLCAANNLQRAQGNQTGLSECISTIKLCFDQFERYYAKQVTIAQRRSNSMSGNGLTPSTKVDSYEVEPDSFKNFIVSLKTFIERQNLPCKANLKQALEEITLDKVQTNHLIFPQGSQLILSQLNRLFGLHLGISQQKQSNQTYDPLENQSPSRSPQRAVNYNARGSLYDQQERDTRIMCPVHGITYCPCNESSINRSATLNNSTKPINGQASSENLLLMSSIVVSGSGQKTPIQHEHQTKSPSFTLQPQFSSGTQGERAAYYQKQDRRQHSMGDFSASRRLKTQESAGYGNSQDTGLNMNMAGEYRPFSTINQGHDDEDNVRPSIQTDKNQPMSLELEHKRTINMSSKSVQKPKKGILKQSSSYLDSSQKKQPVHFKHSTKQAAMHVQPSPYTAMNKKKVLKQTASYPVERGSAKKQGALRYDSQKNLLHTLGHQNDDHPKFNHASSTKNSIFSNKVNLNPDFNNEHDSQQSLGGTFNKKTLKTVVNQGKYIQSANKLSSLAQILRTSSNSHTPANQRQVDEHFRQSPNRLNSKFGGYNNPATHENSAVILSTAHSQNQGAGASLSTTSMKYLRAAQNNAFGQKSNSNNASTSHSNVLLKAQNLQNRNDSFGMHSNYSNQQTNHSKISTLSRAQQPDHAKNYSSNLIQSLMSPQANGNTSRLVSTIQNNNQLMSQSPGHSRPHLHQSPQRSSQNSHLMSSAKRSASFQAGGSSSSPSKQNNRLSGSAGVNYPHPRLSSARKESATHSFGLNANSASNPSGLLRSSEMMSKQSQPQMQQQQSSNAVAHTDFNHVSQFSLSSKKQQTNPSTQNTNPGDYRQRQLF